MRPNEASNCLRQEVTEEVKIGVLYTPPAQTNRECTRCEVSTARQRQPSRHTRTRRIRPRELGGGHKRGTINRMRSNVDFWFQARGSSASCGVYPYVFAMFDYIQCLQVPPLSVKAFKLVWGWILRYDSLNQGPDPLVWMIEMGGPHSF